MSVPTVCILAALAGAITGAFPNIIGWGFGVVTGAALTIGALNRCRA